MSLDERHRRILFAVVTEHIASGKAVSSRCIAKRYAIKLSPATIRNVLSDLEDAELLHQPHTSAGRVPTDAGFRCFVDAIATAGEISDAHRIALLRRLQDLEPGADAVRETGQLLSRLTGTATIIAQPTVAEATLDQLRFMRLSSGRTLAVLVTRSGVVENRVVVTEVAVDDH
ncbi:MAG: HrcA family transcriptional regulator, partial [Polyangiales bacterium]